MKKQGLFVLCILMALSTTSYATMLREIWDHGEPDLDLAEAYMADNAPDETEILDVSMWPDLGRDNYIARLSGWLTVPTTGVYQFYVASDDKSRLYVSPNSDVEDAVVVARVDSWTDSLEWTKLPEQQSADISLKKGQILAVYAVMEEQGGGCDLSIGWTGPDLGTITLISDWVTHIAPTPTIARKPVPDDGAEDVLRDTVLSWTPGQFAATHNLYFSDNFADVNTGTIPMAVLSDTSYDPGRLEFGQTYYWRVDEVNSTPDKTVFKGDIWSFQAEPYSVMIPIDVAKATASSSAALNPPAQTVNGSGLNGVMHSAVSEDMWLSTSPDLNPWLMYEFDRIEKLDQMLIWNSNSSSEGFIGWGIKGVSIETSIDGIEWSALAEPTQLDRAPGEPTYDTPQVVSFGLVQAKFVRLNIQSNWGGLLPQFGVAEVQFYGLPVQAREPVPVSGSSDVRPDAVVTWRSGREAGQHTIYVSDDPNAVADGVAPSASSMTNSAGLSPFDLQMSQTYYWRVDEVNEAEAPSVWTGPVWSLNTATALVVDDFESYTNFSPNRPFQTWLDGYGYSADEFFSVEYPGNGTGAGIGHDIWSPASPNFDGSLMETGISIAGSGQSMPFYYNNTGGTASETQRTFTVPQNWTLAGAKTLSIPFRGTAGNTGTLYVKINGVKVTYPRDSANLAMNGWLAFNIDLASVSTNLQSVTKLAIGVDGSGASGMILIDDITLHNTPGEIVTPTDPGTNGLVAHYTFEGNANDVSGRGNHGTVVGNAQYAAGAIGQAVSLDGATYIDCGNSADFAMTDQVTMAVWMNNPGFVNEWEAIMARGEDSYRMARNDFANVIEFGMNGPAGGWFAGTVTVDDGEWHHVACVYDSAMAYIYVDGVEDVSVARTGAFGVSTASLFIGENSGATGRQFGGMLDDVRIYNRALSAGEALWLAGGTTSIEIPF